MNIVLKNLNLLMLSALAWITTALMPAPVLAQPPGTHPSYVSFQRQTDAIDMPPQTNTVCGGVVVDEKRKLIVTAWHCVPNQLSAVERKGGFLVNGMEAKFVSFLPEADMAIFQVNDLKGVKAPVFKTPKKGDTIIASAYYEALPVTLPSQDRYFPLMNISTTLDWEGKVAAVGNASKREGKNFETLTKTDIKWIVVGGIVASGFSGGPAFDKAGNFVGIISNTNGGFTNISSSENVQIMLRKLP